MKTRMHRTLLTNDESFLHPFARPRVPALGRNGTGSGGASSTRVRAIPIPYGSANDPLPTMMRLPIHEHVLVVDIRTKTVNVLATVLVAASD